MPAKLVFEELGKRKVVGGQEDMILDVVLELLKDTEGGIEMRGVTW